MRYHLTGVAIRKKLCTEQRKTLASFRHGAQEFICDEALDALFLGATGGIGLDDSEDESSGGLPSSEESELDIALLQDGSEDSEEEDIVSEGDENSEEEASDQSRESAYSSRSSLESSADSASDTAPDAARPRRERRGPTRGRV